MRHPPMQSIFEIFTTSHEVDGQNPSDLIEILHIQRDDFISLNCWSSDFLHQQSTPCFEFKTWLSNIARLQSRPNFNASSPASAHSPPAPLTPLPAQLRSQEWAETLNKKRGRKLVIWCIRAPGCWYDVFMLSRLVEDVGFPNIYLAHSTFWLFLTSSVFKPLPAGMTTW